MADNTTLNVGTGGDVIATDDIGGVKHQRVKVEFGADGSASDVSGSTPLPVQMRDDDKAPLHYWAVAVAAGATGVETAITLTRSPSPGGTTTTGASWVPTNAKRFRLTGISFAARGNNTATAQATTFNLRVNTAGAVTTTSAVWLAARVATPATANSWDRVIVPLPSQGIEIAGNGTIAFGVTAAATFTTNAPTWDVLITGYEY